MPQKNKDRLFTLFGNFTAKPGSVPGSVEDGQRKQGKPVTINLYNYDADYKDVTAINSIDECDSILRKSSKTWIQVQGLGEPEQIKSICTHFNLHPLIQEDIINPVQRPKVEQYDEHIFIVMRALQYSDEKSMLESEQISFIIGKNYLLSFQESNHPIFNPIIKRLDISGSQIRGAGIAYLAYALLDTVTDHYFPFLDDINDQLEQIEDDLLDQPDEETLKQIHSVRKDIVTAHKLARPARDMLSMLAKNDIKLIEDSSVPYFQDVHDHMVQIIFNLENFRETSASMYDMYMSESSRKMNEIMKVLTIIATIFIPLTFIAGVYGMNFNGEASPLSMPELNWYWGYPACLAIMLVVAIIMIIYFKRKEWL